MSRFALFASVSRSLLIVCISSSVAGPVGIQRRVVVGTKQQTTLIYNCPYLPGVLSAALEGPINESPHSYLYCPTCITHIKNELSNKLALSKYAMPVLHCVLFHTSPAKSNVISAHSRSDYLVLDAPLQSLLKY